MLKAFLVIRLVGWRVVKRKWDSVLAHERIPRPQKPALACQAPPGPSGPGSTGTVCSRRSHQLSLPISTCEEPWEHGDRQTDTHTHTHTHRPRHVWTHTHTPRLVWRHTHLAMSGDTETHRHRHRHTHTPRHIWRHRHTHTDTHTPRHVWSLRGALAPSLHLSICRAVPRLPDPSC